MIIFNKNAHVRDTINWLAELQPEEVLVLAKKDGQYFIGSTVTDTVRVIGYLEMAKLWQFEGTK